jgi:ADP-heptose:LPS heptosyltransferase
MKNDRFLFVRHGAVGDVLLTTPFFRALHETSDGATIDLFSLEGGVLHGVPGFGSWIPMQEATLERASQGHSGGTFWFTYEHDPTLHILDGYALSSGLQLVDHTLIWSVDPVQGDRAKAQLEGLPRPLIGFSPTSAHVLRTLPQQQIQEIITLISKRLGGTLIVTSEHRLELKGCLNLTGKISSLQELGALMAVCDVWLTVDSAPFHMAQALSVRTVGLFGCTLPELRVTRPSHLHVVREEGLSCLGCYHQLEPFAEALPVCERGDVACMLNLRAETIVNAVKAALDGTPDLNLQGRIEAYEQYKAQRIANLPERYAEGLINAYQARVDRLKAKTGLFRRLERKLRILRRRLNARFLEQK